MKFSKLLNFMIAVSISTVCCVISKPAFAFIAKDHHMLTIFAFEILEEVYPSIFQRYLQLSGEDSRIRNMNYENISSVPARPPSNTELAERVAWEAFAPDYYRDLEFIDIDGEMDNPHENISWEDSDEAAYSTRDDILIGTLEEIFGREHCNFAAFNHFINIGSYGKSLFDDYDGYSYQFIKKYGHQLQRDARLFGEVLDTGIMWYYNDEYIHIPGQRWYDGCSRSIERYSYSLNYPTFLEESAARFPMAKDTGCKGCGIPYSTFFPVDNLARYWYGRFLETNDPLDLGPVMHAIGDAHSSPYCRLSGQLASGIRE